MGQAMRSYVACPTPQLQSIGMYQLLTQLEMRAPTCWTSVPTLWLEPTVPRSLHYPSAFPSFPSSSFWSLSMSEHFGTCLLLV